MNERPLIGVPAMSSAQVKGLRYSGSVVADAVLRAIAVSGGEPVVIPPSLDGGLLAHVDGIVLPGGSDIDPRRYGQIPDETYAGTDFEGQDNADARAITAAEEQGIPTLLICRGLQLWNVERGGSLYQHWPESEVEHVGTVHSVEVAANSRLSEALGLSGTAYTSSYHHQAIDRLGEGLQVTARAADGCIEAVEDPNHAIVAVQWHPEDRAETEAVDSALFAWVVAQATERMRGRLGAVV
ncbi:gamma-glutamyl-gamma-aminobutyrate hydrolase family protein [Brevibacterium spongiae]|uniref:Gamma-glutamyl-gamma-aminobutyrate hydrolase family protein n=1 Tax=Brevibacterium spongiae TaxID=2909672 RepID=A0ABY5STR7_9MICO|nr:gamma-glutamyl-gamma-aminobutyrate hydrolase family protein [Brevibacterium spongiae]UVI36543.1 gamma-glutamyl-gamma-aminobutyrate hydrolase family protein [Brevibacterium spongiae]